MSFWCICGEEGDFHVLFLRHLEGPSLELILERNLFHISAFCLWSLVAACLVIGWTQVKARGQSNPLILFIEAPAVSWGFYESEVASPLSLSLSANWSRRLWGFRTGQYSSTLSRSSKTRKYEKLSQPRGAYGDMKTKCNAVSNQQRWGNFLNFPRMLVHIAESYLIRLIIGNVLKR